MSYVTNIPSLQSENRRPSRHSIRIVTCSLYRRRLFIRSFNIPAQIVSAPSRSRTGSSESALNDKSRIWTPHPSRPAEHCHWARRQNEDREGFLLRTSFRDVASHSRERRHILTSTKPLFIVSDELDDHLSFIEGLARSMMRRYLMSEPSYG